MKLQKGEKLVPLGDVILVELDKPKEKTDGGILLAPRAQKRPKSGVVQAVGPGKVLSNGTLVEPQVAVGDRVYFLEQYAADRHLEQGDGKPLLVFIDEREILAKDA